MLGFLFPFPLVVRARRDAEHVTHEPNFEVGLLRQDKPVERYSLSLAKKAAFFRIAFSSFRRSFSSRAAAGSGPPRFLPVHCASRGRPVELLGPPMELVASHTQVVADLGDRARAPIAHHPHCITFEVERVFLSLFSHGPHSGSIVAPFGVRETGSTPLLGLQAARLPTLDTLAPHLGACLLANHTLLGCR